MGKVIIKNPFEEYQVVELDREEVGLKFLQETVEGLVEVVELPNGYDLWINEEGKLDSLDPNCWLVSFKKHRGELLMGKDVLAGTLIICKHDDEGRSISLTDEEAHDVLRNLKYTVVPVTRERAESINLEDYMSIRVESFDSESYESLFIEGNPFKLFPDLGAFISNPNRPSSLYILFKDEDEEGIDLYERD
ncbi:DUF3846 domain-containing protein [Thermoactinomyces sp. DSM 45892]|uniref:DUF3846 domain-containing protein n=1 Tax=Thermoactinomyces sp. DSM 45892 TaxID=1882753 RepID=UPI0008999BB5|nr:DUF3846 domain-containing protein [Thermoactinomyces sp. DSM 45892]SDX94494.1 protein of unknown function [Thermoactinomyces sp. DSM 45892]